MNPNQDDLDKMLQGDDQPVDSPAQTDGQEDTTKVEQQSSEEVEFNSLTGSTKERIRQLAREKRELQQRLEQQQNTYVPPAPGSNFKDPQEEAAIRTLADKGIALTSDVRKTVDESVNAMRWEFENGRLEGKWHGQEGTPSYVREEVESFIQSHPQYRTVPPEVVFKQFMFQDEFLDYEIKKRGNKTGQSTTFRPTKQAVAQEGMTPEYIENRLQQPDGRQWYDEHLDEINAVLKNMSQA